MCPPIEEIISRAWSCDIRGMCSTSASLGAVELHRASSAAQSLSRPRKIDLIMRTSRSHEVLLAVDPGRLQRAMFGANRLAREKSTVPLMIAIYCRAHHRGGRIPCGECSGLLRYSGPRMMLRHPVLTARLSG